MVRIVHEDTAIEDTEESIQEDEDDKAVIDELGN